MTDAEQADFDASAAKVQRLDTELATAEADDQTQRAGAVSRVDASEIVKLCVDGGVPMMAASLIAEGASVDAAKAQIGAAAQIKEMVALARRVHPSILETAAEDFIKAGFSVERVRTELFDKLVAAQEGNEVRSHVPQPIAGAAGIAASSASMERELKRAGVKKDA